MHYAKHAIELKPQNMHNNNMFNGPLSWTTWISRYQKKTLTHSPSLSVLYNIFN